MSTGSAHGNKSNEIQLDKMQENLKLLEMFRVLFTLVCKWHKRYFVIEMAKRPKYKGDLNKRGVVQVSKH